MTVYRTLKQEKLRSFKVHLVHTPVNVWAGLKRPYFWDKNLNTQRYLDFLSFELVPAMTVLFPNEEDADIPNEEL